MARHPKNKGKKGKYTQEQFQAVQEALKTKSQRQVSRDFNIPKSTINDWVKNPNILIGTGKKTVLEPFEEDMLVEALNYTAKYGFPISRNSLKDMVQSYVLSIGKETSFKDGRPGPDWVLQFERRHRKRLRRRKREGLSDSRATGLTQDNVTQFYELYKEIIEEHNVKNKPWLLFNCDETALTADKTNQKVYVGVEVKNAYSLQPTGTKTCYTVLVCVNAIGQYLPPYVIYKSKNLYNTWCEGGVDGACYGFSESGWMLDINFEAWFVEAFVPQTAAICDTFHRVLIYDGHNSHITYRTVKAAIDNNISIVCLPPATSHALQPLDVGVFRSFKAIYSDVVLTWFKDSRRKSVDKACFPALLKKVWERLDPQHVVNGFRKTGLYPFKSDAVNNKILLTPSDPPSQPNLGPRDSTRMLREAICNALKPNETPEVQEAIANRTRKRTRVQCKCGEVLTKPDVEKRLLEEQKEREAKKKKPTTSKAGKSGVNITINHSATANNTAKATGTLDSFVTRTPSQQHDTTNKQQQDTTKKQQQDTTNRSALVQKGLKDFLYKPGSKKRQQSERSVYKDISTEDSDLDDPDVSALPAKDLIKKLKPGVSHVIYKYEESFRPGLVIQLKKSTIVVKTMDKSGLTTWSWPENKSPHNCKIKDIVDLIPAPKLANNRGKEYFVQKIGNYW